MMMKSFFSFFLALGLTLACQSPAPACEGKCDPADCVHKAKCLHQEAGQGSGAERAEVALDPVCGMKIAKAHAVDEVKYEGQLYYFCMKEEKEAFLKDPTHYLDGQDGEEAPAGNQ